MEIDHLVKEEQFLDDHNDDDDQNNYDTISLCDLLLNQDIENDVVSLPSSPHAFEFSNVMVSESFDHNTTILFCGKPIPVSYGTVTTSGTRTKTTSFSSSSVRESTSDHIRFHVTTTTTSTNSRSRGSRKRHYYNVLIGLPTFPPKMDIADMRRRQNRRRAPVPIIAAEEKIPPPVVAGGGSGSSGSLVRPVRRSNLVSALTRMSFGCIIGQRDV